MASINLKFFKDEDTISSIDYNSNIDAYNNGTIAIDASNVRDQGLDIHNFKDETAVLDKYNDQVTRQKIVYRVLGDELPAGREFVQNSYSYNTNDLNLGTITDATAAPIEVQDETVAIFRCNFEYLISLLETEDAIVSTLSFLKFRFRFLLEATNENGSTFTKYLPQTQRIVTFYGKQLAMKQGYGNIGISTVIDRFTIDPSGLSRKFQKFTLKPHFQLKTNNNTFTAEALFRSGSTFWDGKPSDEKVSLEISNYIANLTVYPRAK